MVVSKGSVDRLISTVDEESIAVRVGGILNRF